MSLKIRFGGACSRIAGINRCFGRSFHTGNFRGDLRRTTMGPEFPDSAPSCPITFVFWRRERILREWTDVGRRRRISADRLEEIATCIEHDWVKGWAVDDIHTQSWIHDIGFKIAASYRSLKMWIMTPKADTRDRLIDRVKQQKLALLNGDWDSLRRGDPPPVIEENRLRGFIGALTTEYGNSPFTYKQPLGSEVASSGRVDCTGGGMVDVLCVVDRWAASGFISKAVESYGSRACGDSVASIQREKGLICHGLSEVFSSRDQDAARVNLQYVTD